MEKILRVYDLASPDAEPLVMEGFPKTIRTAVWHQDAPNTIIAACHDENCFRVWDVRTLKETSVISTNAPTTSLEVSAGSGILTTAEGTSVKFWKLGTLDLVKEYELNCPTESASLFAEKNCFVAGGEDMWVRLFDYSTGEEKACNKGHHGPVHCVRFAPEGDSYASGSEDGTIRIWQTDRAGGAATEQVPAAPGAEENGG